MFSQRRFGIELEFLGLDFLQMKKILNQANFFNWESVEDFSLCSCKNPKDCNDCANCEIVSPILQNQDGLNQINSILEIINNQTKCFVNKTCGFHIHIEAKDLSTKECINIFQRYAKFESIIDLFHPLNRREGRNHYCCSIVDICSEITDNKDEFQTKDDLANFVDKYHKVNLESLSKFGTIEFRQHTGTLDPEEIKNWILFCLDFFEYSIRIPIKNKDCLFDGINTETKKYYESKIQSNFR